MQNGTIVAYRQLAGHVRPPVAITRARQRDRCRSGCLRLGRFRSSVASQQVDVRRNFNGSVTPAARGSESDGQSSGQCDGPAAVEADQVILRRTAGRTAR